MSAAAAAAALDAVPPASAFVRLYRRSDDGTLRSAEQVVVLERERPGAHYSLARAFRRSEDVFEVAGVGGDQSEMRLLHMEDQLTPGEDGQGRGWGRPEHALLWQRMATPPGGVAAAGQPSAAAAAVTTRTHQRKSVEQMLAVQRWHADGISNSVAELATVLVSPTMLPTPSFTPLYNISCTLLQAVEKRMTERLVELVHRVRTVNEQDWSPQLDAQVTPRDLKALSLTLLKGLVPNPSPSPKPGPNLNPSLTPNLNPSLTPTNCR